MILFFSVRLSDFLYVSKLFHTVGDQALNLHNSETIQWSWSEMKFGLFHYCGDKTKILESQVSETFFGSQMLTIHGIIDMTNPDKFDQKNCNDTIHEGYFPVLKGKPPSCRCRGNQYKITPVLHWRHVSSGLFFCKKTFLASKLVHQKSELHHLHSTITTQPPTSNHHHHTSGWLVRTSELNGMASSWDPVSAWRFWDLPILFCWLFVERNSWQWCCFLWGIGHRWFWDMYIYIYMYKENVKNTHNDVCIHIV